VAEREGFEPRSAATQRVLFAPRSVEDSSAERRKSGVRYPTRLQDFLMRRRRMRKSWRRGRDSNPRYGCPYAAFRVRCIQPLCHLSAEVRQGQGSGGF
jgi:hypothetical protein